MKILKIQISRAFLDIVLMLVFNFRRSKALRILYWYFKILVESET